MIVQAITTKKQFFLTTRSVAPGETLFTEDCVACVSFFRRSILEEGNIKLLYPSPLLEGDKIFASPPDKSLGTDGAWSLTWQVLERFFADVNEADAAVAAATDEDVARRDK